MTYEETKKHIKTEVEEICDEIGSICNELCCEHDRSIEYQFDCGTSISDDVFGSATDEQRDKLCKRVKALGQLARLYINENEELFKALQDPDIH